MLTDQFTATLDTFGTARDTLAQARQDAGQWFDHLYVQAQRAQWLDRLTGRALAQRPPAQQTATAPRSGQIVSVPLEAIVGSEDRSGDFDAAFRPLRRNTRDRWISVAVARRQGVALPAVELVQTAEGYYVRDGHHRISVARAAGQQAIEARIVNA
jgi:hypothetical protein